jgi:hypothetical protein
MESQATGDMVLQNLRFNSTEFVHIKQVPLAHFYSGGKITTPSFLPFFIWLRG